MIVYLVYIVYNFIWWEACPFEVFSEVFIERGVPRCFCGVVRCSQVFLWCFCDVSVVFLGLSPSFQMFLASLPESPDVPRGSQVFPGVPRDSQVFPDVPRDSQVFPCMLWRVLANHIVYNHEYISDDLQQCYSILCESIIQYTTCSLIVSLCSFWVSCEMRRPRQGTRWSR